MSIKHTILPLMLLLSVVNIYSQRGLNQYDRTALGPYPIFVEFYFKSHETNFKEYTKFHSENNIPPLDLNSNRNINGVGGSLGIQITTNPTILGKIGYESLKIGSYSDITSLTLTSNTLFFNAGVRMTPFYPFTFHLWAGINYRNDNFLFDNSAVIRRIVKDNKFHSDLNLRFTFFDPVGTGGGLGFFVGMSVSTKSFDYPNLVNNAPLNINRRSKLAGEIGLISALALRFK